MKTKAIRISAALVVLLSLLLSFAANAAGVTVYTNTRSLADNFEYINTVKWDAEFGRTESFAVRMTGPGQAYPIVMNGDTIYGGFTISRMVGYAESQGKNVLAAINLDFFSQSTVPLGIVIEDGVYKSSVGERNAVTIGYDGGISIIESPSVWISLRNEGGEDRTNAGKSVNMRNFNKIRTDLGGLVLYSEDFSTISTRTSSPGWFVRFKVLEGFMSVSGVMELEVVETLTSEDAVQIGEGYLVLTAADKSNLSQEYEKFAVGDRVTLTTTCTDNRLADAQYASGGGDIIISDGFITDPADWTNSLMSRAPRTAFGVLENGLVVCYVVDGRNSEHSVGLTMTELAEEMERQGCVYAVNMDGGGSSALSIRTPGNEKAAVVSRPSDGSERGCATYLLFVTDAVPDGMVRNLSLKNDGLILLANSMVDFEYAATDGGCKPVAPPADIIAEVMDPEASVNGVTYTAGSTAGTETVLLYSASTGAYGYGEVYVITRPTSITVTGKGSAKPLTSVRLAPGANLELGVTATYHRRNVIAQIDSFTYEVSGDIGEMTEPGLFTAGLTAGNAGTITVSAGGRDVEIRVEISGFADMENHWAKEYVEFLLQIGITNGITATEYGPSALMKRGDFILMLHRAAGTPDAGNVNAFDDVPEDMYYSQALLWAKKIGIAEGADGNNFYPEEPLTRQDAFTFTYRALAALNKEYVDGTEADLEGFPDADSVDDYAIIPTATLIKLGIVDGSNGMLSPHSTLTRAQMAKVLATTLWGN